MRGSCSQSHVPALVVEVDLGHVYDKVVLIHHLRPRTVGFAFLRLRFSHPIVSGEFDDCSLYLRLMELKYLKTIADPEEGFI
jgi:hypothetical protein